MAYDDAIDCGCCGGDVSESEMSSNLDGSDADHYYELKDMRQERKRELWKGLGLPTAEEKQHMREAQLQKDVDIAAEAEVKAAYEAMLEALDKGETPTIAPLGTHGRKFMLHSVDHLNLVRDEAIQNAQYHPRMIQFCIIHPERTHDEVGDDSEGTDTRGNGPRLEGDLYGLSTTYSFENMDAVPPSRPNREGIKFGIEGDSGVIGDMEVTFITNDYLIIKVPREVPLHAKGSTISEAALPEHFVFYGKASETPKRVKASKKAEALKEKKRKRYDKQGEASKQKKKKKKLDCKTAGMPTEE